MRNRLLITVAVLLICFTTFPVAQARGPNIRDLKLAAQLPSDLPQKIMGLAYDGEQLWATIYLGGGLYAKLNPATLTWTIDRNAEHQRAIAAVAKTFKSPAGVCFANGKLWISGFYGDSFGSIDKETWEVDRVFRGKQRPHHDTTQSYASMAYDGNNIWIAWHWFKYDRPAYETQLLLKVDPTEGRVITEYPLPAGTATDGTHGLTWDGTWLWHIKDQKLSAIDRVTGAVVAQYRIPGVNRPSGLAWAKDALWISEFEGQIWHLPFN